MTRHWLLAVGISSYRNLPAANIQSAAQDVESIVQSFERIGYQRIHLPNHGLNLTKPQFDGSFREWIRTQAQPQDTLAFYFVGHGQSNNQTRVHYLYFSDVDPHDLSTAFATQDLLDHVVKKQIDGTVRYPVARALFLIDSCYSGDGVRQFVQKAYGYLDQRTPPQIVLIPSSRPDKPALPFTFSQAWASAVARVLDETDRADPFLPLDAVMESVRQNMRGVPQKPYWEPAAGIHGPLQFLPNSRYDPSIPSGLDLDSRARYDRELLEHWVPRAKGGESLSDAWYFTGREDILDQIVTWLRQERSDGKCRLVTGGPGTGKSAVLGRLVTLSDPEWRARALSSPDTTPTHLLPGENTFSCVLLARKRNLQTLAMLLADSLGLDELTEQLRSARGAEEVEADVHRLVEAIRNRDDKTVILIDALDESTEAALIAGRLLRHLTGLDHVWLLVGSRPIGTPTTGALKVAELGLAVIELDLDRHSPSSIIAKYVQLRLLVEEDRTRFSPYRGRRSEAAVVADAVAHQAAGVFLIARIVASSLLELPEPVKPNQYSFPSKIDEAFDDYLEKIAGRPDALGKQRLLELLAPFAFAEGEGLARDYLLDIVSAAVCHRVPQPEEIDWLFQHAGAFIVQGTAADRSVYRLYHEELARHVRSKFPDVEGAITESLVASVTIDEQGHRRWSNAHPYVLRHVVRHAIRTQYVDRLLEDAAFLATIEPVTLVPHLSSAASDRSRQSADTYLLVSHRLTGASYAERLSYLELTARQLSYESLAESCASVTAARPWTPVWAEWERVDPHRVLNAPTFGDQHLVLGDVAGTPHLIAAVSELFGERSILVIWNLATGDPNPTTIATDIGDVAGICLLHHRSGPILMLGSGRSLRLWNLHSMTELPELTIPKTIEMSCFCAFQLTNGPSGIVVGDTDGGITIYDYETKARINGWVIEKGVKVEQLACVEANGRLVTVAQTSQIQVIFDALAQRSNTASFAKSSRGRSRFHVAQGATGPTLITSDYEHVTSRDLTDGGDVEFSYQLPDLIGTATTLPVRERHLLLCASLTRQEFSFYDMTDGTRVGRRVGAHAGVTQMFAFTDRDAVWVVTADNIRTVKLWRISPEHLAPDSAWVAGQSRADIRSVAFVAEPEAMLFKMKTRMLEICRAGDGSLIQKQEIPSYLLRLFDACQAPGEWLVAGWESPDLHMLRVRPGHETPVTTEVLRTECQEYRPQVLCAYKAPYRLGILAAPRSGRLDGFRIFRPWWRRVVDRALGRPAVAHGQFAADDRLEVARLSILDEHYVIACTRTHLHVLDAATFVERKRFELPKYAFTRTIAAFEVEGGPVIVRLSTSNVFFHDWNTGRQTEMPWTPKEFTCIDVLRAGAAAVWVTGCTAGHIDVWRPGRSESLISIDIGASVERVFALPKEDRVIAYANDGLVCLQIASLE